MSNDFLLVLMVDLQKIPNLLLAVLAIVLYRGIMYDIYDLL